MGRRVVLFIRNNTLYYILLFLYSLLLVCRERSDKTNSSAKTILYWINLFCGQNNITKYQWKEVIIGAAGAVLMYLCWKSSGGIDYPANYLIILAMKDVDLKKVMKAVFHVDLLG